MERGRVERRARWECCGAGFNACWSATAAGRPTISPGFRSPDDSARADLVALLGSLPEGAHGVHVPSGPSAGTRLRAARTRLKESREQELRALVAPETRAALERNGIELARYEGLGK